MDKKAIQLNARFSLPPNSLGYCGKDSAPEKFKSCVINGKCKGVDEEFKHFIVLHPYLRTLSKINKLPKFSYKVIESYWMGNDLLKKAKNSDYQILLSFFKKQGVPDWLVNELKEKKPKKFIPTHLFQVLHVGVGRASGSVPYNIETINNCMIRWGEVEKVNKSSAVVSLNSLKKVKGVFKIAKVKETRPFINGFVPNIKKGDTVIVHWSQIIKILSEGETKKIDYWTKEILKIVN
jgi:hydrogenase maturation factor